MSELRGEIEEIVEKNSSEHGVLYASIVDALETLIRKRELMARLDENETIMACFDDFDVEERIAELTEQLKEQNGEK